MNELLNESLESLTKAHNFLKNLEKNEPDLAFREGKKAYDNFSFVDAIRVGQYIADNGEIKREPMSSETRKKVTEYYSGIISVFENYIKLVDAKDAESLAVLLESKVTITSWIESARDRLNALGSLVPEQRGSARPEPVVEGEEKKAVVNRQPPVTNAAMWATSALSQSPFKRKLRGNAKTKVPGKNKKTVFSSAAVIVSLPSTTASVVEDLKRGGGSMLGAVVSGGAQASSRSTTSPRSEPITGSSRKMLRDFLPPATAASIAAEVAAQPAAVSADVVAYNATNQRS